MTIQVTPKKGQLADEDVGAAQSHDLGRGRVIRVRANDILEVGPLHQASAMNVPEADRVSAIARVAAGKKAPKTRGIAEGQTVLAEGEGAATPPEVEEEDRDFEAENSWPKS
jgi:hypothetical protein